MTSDASIILQFRFVILYSKEGLEPLLGWMPETEPARQSFELALLHSMACLEGFIKHSMELSRALYDAQ